MTIHGLSYRMSRPRFTDGNLIVLYANHTKNDETEALPNHVIERVKVCVDLYRIIISSKPDRKNTLVLIIADERSAIDIRKMLMKSGVDENIVQMTPLPKNVPQTFDYVLEFIQERANPPYIYFVASNWQRDISDSVAMSKMRDYQTRFEGAPDHRPVDDVAKDKALNMPTKGIEYYKNKLKNKAVDMVINYIFPDEKKS
jgi:hypothetical protein